MTVQDLLDKAVRLIGDYNNISSYGTNNLDDVSTIVAELMRLGIGVNSKYYKTEIPDTAPYTPTDTTVMPVALPTDLTVDDQILSVSFDNGSAYDRRSTETHSGTLYLLIPTGVTGSVIVQYVAAAPNFALLTTVLPISDEAVNAVARFGLAELLSYDNADDYTEEMAKKYLIAKSQWRRRDYNPKRIRATYNY
jgi:hypothetical protein